MRLVPYLHPVVWFCEYQLRFKLGTSPQSHALRCDYLLALPCRRCHILCSAEHAHMDSTAPALRLKCSRGCGKCCEQAQSTEQERLSLVWRERSGKAPEEDTGFYWRSKTQEGKSKRHFRQVEWVAEKGRYFAWSRMQMRGCRWSHTALWEANASVPVPQGPEISRGGREEEGPDARGI